MMMEKKKKTPVSVGGTQKRREINDLLCKDSDYKLSLTRGLTGFDLMTTTKKREKKKGKLSVCIFLPPNFHN